MQRVELGQ